MNKAVDPFHTLYQLARIVRNTDRLTPMEYGRQVTELITDISRSESEPLYDLTEKDVQKYKVRDRLVRLVTNIDGLQPSTWGNEAGQLLVKLRILDGERYDAKVIASELVN